jgi:hypothetical protein
MLVALVLLARVAADPTVVLSEFMADNTRTLRDVDGEYSDWIELENLSSAPVNLDGWRLTDDSQHRSTWALPATNLPPGGFLIVFASGKNRRIPGEELHASFRLAAAGEYLALLTPALAVATAFSPTFPAQLPDVAYGWSRAVSSQRLVAPGDTVRIHVPTAGLLGTAWTGSIANEPFDDSAEAGWQSGFTGVGFDSGTIPDGMGPLAYWDFNAVQNSRVADGSGRGNTGTLVGIALTADRGGRTGAPADRALDLGDGAGRMIVPSAAQGAFDSATRSNALTVSLWIWGGNQQPANGSVFWFQEYADGTGARAAQAHLPWSDSVIYWDTGQGGDCCSGAARMSKVEPDSTRWKGRWNHYVFLKRGAQKEIWQKGTLFAQADGSYPLASLRSLAVGSSVDGSMRFPGWMDDVAIWDRALSAEEIGALTAGASPLDLRGFTGLIQTRLNDSMRGRNASVYLRMAFLPTVPAEFDSLQLRLHYDAGFIAYLNGVEIARRNAPDPDWNATATTARRREDALRVEELDLPGAAALLRPGENILAFHGLNESADDPAFLLRPELIGLSRRAGRFLPTSTPGQPNGAGVLGFLTAPRFSIPHGIFRQAIELELQAAEPGSTLVYTTNGSPPSLTNGVAVTPPSAGLLASVRLPIADTTVVRAASFRDGFEPSPSVTQTYVFAERVARQPARPAGLPIQWADGSAADYEVDPDVVNRTLPGYGFTEALESLPILSVVAAPTDLWDRRQGIYSNPVLRGDDWERPVSAELIFPDGSPGFQVNCGAHIHGNISRQNDFTQKHSFRLVFRSRYGPSDLEFPLFGETGVRQFDEVVVKGLSTDSWPVVEWGANGEGYVRWWRREASYIRDQWVRDAYGDMGQIASRGRFVHLFLNGLYWGLYNLTEHPSSSFQAQHYGGRRDEYDVFKDFTELDSGNTQAWDAMMALAGSGLGSTAAIQRIEGSAPDGTPNSAYPRLLNVENLIDYMILHIFIGADDWPNHNWWAARRRGPESGGFRFFPWDQEISNNSLQRTQTSWGGRYEEVDVPGTPAFLYSRLRGNADFRLRFADRVHRHLFNDGALTPAANDARWKRRATEIDRALVAESARWGDARRSTPYRREVEWLAVNRWMQDEYWPKIPAIAIARFRRVGLYPSVAAPVLTPHGGVINAGTPVVIGAAEGMVYWTTDGTDPRRPDGSIHPSASAAAAPVDVTLAETRRLKARVRSGTTWSALTEALFTVPGSYPLIVSRLMFHPPPQTDAERTRSGGEVFDAEQYEFIELQNLGTTAVPLGGISFIEGIQFTFPDAVLAALERVVVVRHRPAFENRYGTGIRVAGEYGDTANPGLDSQLSNAGERLVLVDPRRNPIFEFAYSDDWYPNTDGDGSALERLDGLADAGAPGSWRSGSAWGGNPGRPVEATPPSLIAVADGGPLRLQLEVRAGQAIRLDWTDSLGSPNWSTTEVRPMMPEQQTIEITVPEPASGSAFYRVVAP